MVPKRQRPAMAITVSKEVHDRVIGLTEKLPGASISAVCEELFELGLPVMEQMADALVAARDAEGKVDEEKARAQVHQWAGEQLLGLSDKPRVKAKGGEDD